MTPPPQHPTINIRSTRSHRLRQQRAINKALDIARNRLVLFFILFIFCFGAIGFRLINLMVLDGPASAALRTRTLPPQQHLRANIVDRNGEVLATTLITASLYADAKMVMDPKEAAQKLAKIFPDLAYQKTLEKLASNKRFVWLKRNLTPRQQYLANAMGLPGIDFQYEEQRFYPHGRLAAHVIGYTDIDGNGLAGIENALDKRLRTTQGPLQLSLDIRLQEILATELQKAITKHKAKGGSGLILDARTSEVLASVSLPDFNPRRVGQESPDHLFNRASLGVYEMGSTFKIFTAAMALDAGTATMASTYNTKNPLRVAHFTIHDFKRYGDRLSLPEVILHSSNIGAAKIALDVGVKEQQRFFDKIGLLAPSDIELPENGQPLLPARWNDITLQTLSFGYGLAISPLQLVNGIAAMVNGGIYRPATLLKDHGTDGMVFEAKQVIKPETSHKIRKLMHLVVSKGTGSKAKNTGYLIGGKTGTAHKSLGGGYDQGAVMASFVAAFPIHDPQYVVYALIDDPKATPDTFGYATGGWVAVPVVRNTIERMAPILGIAPVVNTPSIQNTLLVKGFRTTSYGE